MPPSPMRAISRNSPRRSGKASGELLRSASELLFDHSLFNGHPRFFGYITSSPAPIGMLGDFLAAAVNANVGAADPAKPQSYFEVKCIGPEDQVIDVSNAGWVGAK